MQARLTGSIAAIAIAFLATMNVAKADVIDWWKVTDAKDTGHGLWTNTAPTPNSFSVQDGTFWKFDDNTARLQFLGKNSDDVLALVTLNLSGFMDTIAEGNYKKENGVTWSESLGTGSPTGHESTSEARGQDYYSSIIGDVKFYEDMDKYDNGIIDETVLIGATDASYKTFQFGWGANAKDANQFGGSAWVKTTSSGITSQYGSTSHWDINIGFTNPPEGSSTPPVPEPGSLALVALGLAGLVPMRRRRK